MGAIFHQLSIREDADHEDVRWAMSTASALWAKGALEDAVRWLRRAGNAATEVDDDVLAVEIFKAAAEIQAELDEGSSPRSSVPAPPPSPAPRSRSTPPPLPPPRPSAPPRRSLPPPKKPASSASTRPSRPERAEEVKALRVAVYSGSAPGEVCLTLVPVGSDVPAGAIGGVLVPMDGAEMRDLRMLLERRITH